MPQASGGRSADQSAHGRELAGLVRPVVEAAGFDLETVTVTPAGRRSIVRVVVDSDRGVDLDAVAEISRTVSERLDDQTPGGAAFAGPYVLEVTSPGVDRPVQEPRHWRRSVGRIVAVPVDERPLTGRVVAVRDEGVEFDVDGDRRMVEWPSLGTGRVQIEFSRAAPKEV